MCRAPVIRRVWGISVGLSETVRQAHADGGTAAVLGLARASRGPVVEPAPGSPDCDVIFYDVTFVLADPRGAPRQVALFCPALPSGFARLTAVGDGVFAGTFRLPRASRVPYHFCLDPPDELEGAALAELARSPAGRRLDRMNPSFVQVHIRGLRLRILHSLLTLPGARPAPAARHVPGAGRGSFEELTVNSRALGRAKKAVLYRPAGTTAAPHQVVVMLQGNEEWHDIAFLDNLAASMRGAPLLAVLFSEHSFTAKLRDFGSGTGHTRFIVDELWPELTRRVPVRAEAAVAGFSAGGVAAATLAAEEPGLFPRLALISAALQLNGSMDVRRAGDGSAGLLGRFGNGDRAPQRAYLAAGWYEDAWDAGIHDGTSALAQLLGQRGTTVRFDSGPTGHDTISARAYLADGLGWLFASG